MASKRQSEDVLSLKIVRSSDGKSIQLNVSFTTTLLTLQRMLHSNEHFGIDVFPPSRQRIFYLGRELKTAGRSLSSLGIGKHNVSVLHLHVRPSVANNNDKPTTKKIQQNRYVASAPAAPTASASATSSSSSESSITTRQRGSSRRSKNNERTVDNMQGNNKRRRTTRVTTSSTTSGRAVSEDTVDLSRDPETIDLSKDDDDDSDSDSNDKDRRTTICLQSSDEEED